MSGPQRGGPRSVAASTPDSHAGGPGFKSRCHPTNFRPVWSPKSIPIPRLKSKNGKDFPEEGEVGAEGLWFPRAPREAKKKKKKVRAPKHFSQHAGSENILSTFRLLGPCMAVKCQLFIAFLDDSGWVTFEIFLDELFLQKYFTFAT